MILTLPRQKLSSLVFPWVQPDNLKTLSNHGMPQVSVVLELKAVTKKKPSSNDCGTLKAWESQQYNVLEDMGLRHDLAKDFRSKPPKKIDFDDLNSQTKRVLTTLDHAAEVLVDKNGGTAAVEAAVSALDRNWLLIWPWMDVMVQAIREDPLPSTSEGFLVLQTFYAMALVILVYPASNPAHEDDRHLSQGKLAHLVESYPTVILHLMSIWVRATELGLGPTIVAGALHAIVLCLESLTGNEKAVG
ncbi:hypothetical protein PM082_021321 [Marasmius tenuissimus]|nr:hypothetical protein PM082_021321 [Marasmius tenuissimus]